MELAASWDRILGGEYRVVRRFDDGAHWYAVVAPADGRDRLSERQRSIIQDVADGASHCEIAYDLGITVSTVATHLAIALRTLGLARTDLPALARGACVERRSGSEVVLVSAEVSRELVPELTEAERNVIRAVVAGRDNREIAEARGTSVRTVANQLAEIFRKLGRRSRLELIVAVSERFARPGVWSAAAIAVAMLAFAWTTSAHACDKGEGCVSVESDASHGAYPLAYADRPITHRMGTFVTTIGSGIGIPTDGGDVGAASGISFSYGLLNYLELDVAPARVLWAPQVTYLDPSVGLSLRFFPSPVFELGARTEVYVPIDGGDTAQSFTVPIRIHMGGVARIDTGVRFSLLYDGDIEHASMGVPFGLAFNFGPHVYLGVEAELAAATDAVDRGAIYYTARLGGTVPIGDRPFADIELRVQPFSLDLDGANGATVDASNVSVSLSATFYFHLVG